MSMLYFLREMERAEYHKKEGEYGAFLPFYDGIYVLFLMLGTEKEFRAYINRKLKDKNC